MQCPQILHPTVKFTYFVDYENAKIRSHKIFMKLFSLTKNSTINNQLYVILKGTNHEYTYKFHTEQYLYVRN
jgi:hypothetical protein